MKELSIDREFDDLCPALTDDEERLLEQSLLADGCLHSIVTWANHGDTVLDGHNRYRLCKKNGVSFTTKAIKIGTRDEAKAWILDQQCGRRNLTDSQRAMMAAKRATLGQGQKKSDAHQCASSQTDAAEQFGVSRRTVQQAAKVIAEGAKPLQRAVESGEIPLTQAVAIAELPKAEQAKVVERGPEAVAAKVRKVKEKKKAEAPKQYKDSFDTGKLDKELTKDKKPGSIKQTFRDKDVDDLLGKLARLYDQRWNELAGRGSFYHEAMKKLKEAQAAWAQWRDWKGPIA